MSRGLIIGVIVVGIIVGVGAYAMLETQHEAHVRIYVDSANVLNDLDVLIYVDGNLVGHGTAKASATGSTVYLDHTVKFKGDSQTITIKAVGQGGFWGTKQDTKQLIVVDGGSYNIHLSLV